MGNAQPALDKLGAQLRPLLPGALAVSVLAKLALEELDKGGARHRFKMFSGSIPLHNLDGLREILQDKILNPKRTITEKDQSLTTVRSILTDGCPQQFTKPFCLANLTGIALLDRPQENFLPLHSLLLTYLALRRSTASVSNQSETFMSLSFFCLSVSYPRLNVHLGGPP